MRRSIIWLIVGAPLALVGVAAGATAAVPTFMIHGYEVSEVRRPVCSGPAQHSATNETVSPVRNVIVEMTLQPSSIASRHPSLLQ